MRHLFLLAGRFLPASLLLALGFIASGCGDSATVNPVVELAGLEVALTNGSATLQPAFNGGTTQYRVDLSSNIERVTISARPAVSGDTVTIDGQTTTSRPITLDPPGSTTVVNIVVSESTTNSRTYTVRLIRAGLAGNNSLQSLTMSPGALPPPGFNSETLSYSVDVASNVGSVAVTPTPSDAAATMTVNGQAAISGQPSTVTLGEPGSNTRIDIVVTAQNNIPKTYTIFVNRGGLSGNNSLQSLTVSPGTLAPTFNANLLTYSVDVANNVGSVSVTPTRQDSDATIAINGQTATSGQAHAVPLNGPGQSTTITIVVTAQNGNTKTYLVTVSRGVSNNNNLQGLTISQGTLSPAFRASTTDYTVEVASSVASVGVTPRLQDSDASMTVNGQTTSSGQTRTIQLGTPNSTTPIIIIVTAQNGTQKVYTLTVIRAALGGNNNLQRLTVSPGPLVPAFTSGTTNYSVDVGSSVASVTITPTLQDTTATMTVNGQVTNSGQARTITLRAAGLNTSIPIVVTAPNGSSKTYTITIDRAALASNNNLSVLTVSPGSLAPAFAQNTLNYTVDVSSTVTSVNVSATKADPNAVLSGDVTAGAGTATGQATIQLDGPGTSKNVSITVTAPNGSSKLYRITVNRAALASNNNLSALSVTPGSLAPGFASGTLNYTVGVATDISSINVSATKADPNAVMSGDVSGGTGVATGEATIPLNGAGTSTSVSITVTAPNGSPKTYTITVNRAAPAAPPAPASAPDLLTEDDSCPLLEPPDSNNPDPDGCFPGTSRSDNITNVNTPRFRIAPPAAGQTPNLYVDGARVDSTFEQATNTLTPTTALSDGVHAITYTMTNAGGESGPSPSLTVRIDNVAPGGPGG
ncbi:MAG: cadherin-like beta sandwich domain-containing protein [Nitrospira sp.]|nr:cadherin-like beta sandwich domain-containing protein [Nitrospira sp.]